jgi:hypothetical protein
MTLPVLRGTCRGEGVAKTYIHERRINYMAKIVSITIRITCRLV